MLVNTPYYRKLFEHIWECEMPISESVGEAMIARPRERPQRSRFEFSSPVSLRIARAAVSRGRRPPAVADGDFHGH